MCRLGLVTDRAALILQAAGGVIVEVFEWRDGAKVSAHTIPEVQSLWDKYAKICNYVPLSSLPETSEVFASFKPIDGLGTEAE